MNFLRKIAYFSKRFKKPCVSFSRVWTKITNSWKFWINFENFQTNSLNKIAKNALAYFSKFRKPCATFSRVWTKITNSWKSLINFLKLSQNLFRKFRNIHYLSIFFEKFNKACVNFSRVWTKYTNY